MSKEEDKVKREIMTMSRLHRIPYPVIDSKVRPLVKICMKCAKNKVIHHHFLCDACWLKQKKRKIQLNNQRRNKNG